MTETLARTRRSAVPTPLDPARPTAVGRLVSVATGILVVLASAALWAWRSWPSIRHGNLYGEDALVFLDNINQHGPAAMFIRFNGYLVIGIYAAMLLAVGVIHIAGLSFAHLAVVVGVVSCLSLGAISSVPYLLLRRRIGTLMSLAIVLALTFTPMISADADIIGSIGNLKFAVLPLAFMLIVYRMGVLQSRARVVAVDVALLLCALTNILVVALLPALLGPALLALWKRLRTRAKVQIVTFDRVSAIILGVLSGIYLVIDVALGIPKYPGYLDGPYQSWATLPLVHHSTTYAFLYPLGAMITVWAVIALLVATTVWALWMRPGRAIYVFALYACAIGTAGFVTNRPGVSALMVYGPVTDQFFYGQVMLWTFAVLYVLALRIQGKGFGMRLFTAAFILVFVVAGAPSGATFGTKALDLLAARGTFYSNVNAACASTPPSTATVSIRVIPLPQYVWQVPRAIACDDR